MQIYRNNRAYNELKRQTKGLPMAKGRNIIFNHTLLNLAKSKVKMLSLGHESHGYKNVALLHHERHSVSTIDPNLMKRVVLDQPNKNINRMPINGAASDLTTDTLMFAEDEQWHRLRRAVAPAFR